MPKVRIEQASNAIINPPHPGDPTSHVTRDGGEPLHKPPQPGAKRDEETGEWYNPVDRQDDENVTVTDDDNQQEQERRGGEAPAAVPSVTGRDHWASGDAGPAQSPYLEGGESEEWRDDPLPEGAQERLDWAQRGTDTEARINAAVRAEEARGNRKRTTVLSGLEALRKEHRRNESDDK